MIQELRLGNWFDVNGNPEQVVELSIHGLNGMEGDLLGQASPIPLTPEILLDCGFVYETDKKTHLQYRPEDPIYIGFYLKDGGSEITNTQIYQSSDVFGYGLLTDVPPLKSLHQLQNLYFCLTGNELNYKS